MAEVTMPRLSDTMSEGSVGKWLKQVGDKITDGEIIAEIETDKATMELQSFESGTLQRILVEAGKVVPIGEVIAIIGDGAAPAASASAPAAAPPAAAPAPDASAAPAPAAPAAPSNGQGDDHIKASPLARKLAAERGIDLRLVQGTGPGGRIIKENVEEFQPGTPASASAPAPQPAAAAPVSAPTPAPAPAPAPTPNAAAEPLGRMRRAIARAMNDAKPGIPHIYVTVEVDMGAAMKLRQQINESGAAAVKVSVNDLVVKAAAKALAKLPVVNTSFATTSEGQPGVVRHDQVNVSVAVALDDGLIAPVIKDADKKSIGTIAAEVKDMAGRAREGKIKQNELEGATFQVTNLGMYGVVEFGSIITVPQVASLAVGAVRQVPVVRDGAIVVGEVMNVTLSADHRIVDGAVAAQYLAELRKLLEAPMSLLV
ncbi:MAG: 2-oxo acid dehydrogenase subunit E2 [Chloroflexi bacterium SZAS-1]|jgi:pyruvate dehydrogenase E2 component (dihydrolipoamide acetyltransferase)|nr:2-oxo acid dehydrogenase subunit E2 [Chloroflexi bacterium SZAS-1]